MLKDNFEVEVLINGNPAKEYYQKKDKVYIEGRCGQEYVIKIKNKSWKRAVAVVSVDGLSVLDGEEASHDSSGYIIGGYDSIKIKGWRVDNDNVNEFYFSNLEESYAHRTNKCGNQGIIGVALFFEKQQDPFGILTYVGTSNNNFFNGGSTLTNTTSEFIRCSASSEASSVANSNVNVNYCASQPEAKSDLGTGFGEEIHDSVTNINFERESNHPSEVIELNYASRRSLKEIGIDFRNRPKYVTGPASAFPGNYCKPPKGYCRGRRGRRKRD